MSTERWLSQMCHKAIHGGQNNGGTSGEATVSGHWASVPVEGQPRNIGSKFSTVLGQDDGGGGEDGEGVKVDGEEGGSGPGGGWDGSRGYQCILSPISGLKALHRLTQICARSN